MLVRVAMSWIQAKSPYNLFVSQAAELKVPQTLFSGQQSNIHEISNIQRSGSQYTSVTIDKMRLRKKRIYEIRSSVAAEKRKDCWLIEAMKPHRRQHQQARQPLQLSYDE